MLEAIERGLNVEAGLHTILAEDPEFSAAADAKGVSLRDLRLAPPDIGVASGSPSRRPGLKVVHSVGSDVAIGKKAVALELDMAARRRELRSVYVPTGQTGIAIAGWGIAVDHVLSDYVSGAAERLVHEGGERGDLLFVEGQGCLFHPAYSAVTLGLLHGSSPDDYEIGAAVRKAGYQVAIPPLSELVSAYEMVSRPLRPTRVAAIALNTADLDEAAARSAVEEAEADTGLVVDDLVRFGPDRVLDAVLSSLETPV